MNAGTIVIATSEFTAYIYDETALIGAELEQFVVHNGVAGRVVSVDPQDFGDDKVRVIVKWYGTGNCSIILADSHLIAELKS